MFLRIVSQISYARRRIQKITELEDERRRPNTWRKKLSTFCLAILLLLSACGGPEQETVELGYELTPLELPEGESIAAIERGLMVMRVRHPVQDGSRDYYNTYYAVPVDGGEKTEYPELEGLRLSNVHLDPEGRLWASYVREDAHVIVSRAPSGGLEEYTLQDFGFPEDAWLTTYQPDDYGRLGVCTFEEFRLIDLETMEVLHSEPTEQFVNLALDAHGELVLYSAAEGDSDVTRRGLRIWKPGGEELRLDENWGVFDGGGGYDLYLLPYSTEEQSVYGLDLETGEREELFDVLSLGLYRISLPCALDDGSFIFNGWTGSSESSSAWYRLYPAEEREVETLTLATLEPGAAAPAVSAFNQRSPDVKISLRDYSEIGIDALITEIGAGNMPDILDLTGLPAERYATAGLLLDLYPLLDADPDIERGDLFPALLAALETDGHLYSIPTGYYLVAVCGNPETIALTEGLTLAEADAAVRAAGFGSLFWRQLSRDMALRYGLLLGNFADYDAGTARFTDGDFAELLEYAATLPEVAASAAEWPTELYEGGQAVCLTGIYTIEDFASLKVYLGGEVALTPLFSEQGRYVAELMGGYAVTSACGNTEAAWDFLRTYLGPEPRTRPYEDGLPLNIAAYESGIETP